MRKKSRIKKRVAKEDFVYESVELEKFINYVMGDGKKDVARRVVYKALDIIKTKEKKENPLEVFELAIKNASPAMEVRSRRIGGATYQVPREVSPNRKMALAMRWILIAARSKKGSSMSIRLANELMAVSNNEGEALKKKENVEKMAQANMAFAHFAW